MKKTLVSFGITVLALSQFYPGITSERSVPVTPERGDYLSPSVRGQVEQLKREAADEPTSASNIVQRGQILWDWLNALSLTGAPIPVDATYGFSSISEMADEQARGTPYEPSDLESLAARFDNYISEFRLKDEHPDALGSITLSDRGPFPARSWGIFQQILTIGEMPMQTGGGVVVGVPFVWDGGYPQHENPSGDNFVSLSCSHPDARFEKIRERLPGTGMHEGFRGNPVPAFRLVEGSLQKGEKIVLTYGDQSGGSRGLLMQSTRTDAAVLPLYVDLQGKGLALTPKWPSFEIEGRQVESVQAFAPSVVEAGESFDVAVRSQDDFFNRAGGAIPAYQVTLNGEAFRRIPAGGDAITILKDIRLELEGVFRFGFRSLDGTILGSSNPVWVQKNPTYRIYWGETHAHTAMAEGQGRIDTFYRYGRDDARLDFLGLSEHDIWLDALEWRSIRDAVSRYSEEGHFVAFMGYEWTGRRASGGHHNVFLRTPNLAVVPVQQAYRLALLYQRLREKNKTDDVLIIPHGHNPGDWRMNDVDMEPVVEIQSLHGTFEWFGNYYLRNGFQVGFVAASDDHRSRPGYAAPIGTVAPLHQFGQFGGLAAVMATEKTSTGIFNALKERRCYAVTSAQRIILDVEVNGTAMGQRAPYQDRRVLESRVMGTAPLDEIVVVKNGSVVYANYPPPVPLRSDVTVQVAFESSSEPFMRDNPRGYRIWKGKMRVRNGKLTKATSKSENHHLEELRIDPEDQNRLSFHLKTRGDTEVLILELRGASSATELILELTETNEIGSSSGSFRSPATIPARQVRLPFSQLSEGRLEQNLPVDRHNDRIRVRLVDPNGPMDRQFTFVDTDRADPGDYYYVRVRQQDGAMAWSSPIWVGGEPRR